MVPQLPGPAQGHSVPRGDCPGWTRTVNALWNGAKRSDLLPGEVVAIDGKTVRRSHDKRAGKQAIHLVSAWAAANTLTLGQVKTDQKSNEITAICWNCLS